ncbi:YugN-like family protein [Microaerobacter geothermalis]|nr:YugN-like family protein [Microaerobacter geothermalis]
MILIRSDIEGKEAVYKEIKEPFEKEGFSLGGGWGYEGGMMDAPLGQEEGKTIYLRIPIQVIEGALDHEDAKIRFGTPFIVNHVVQTGTMVDPTENPFFGTGGISSLTNQFTEPLDKDARIENEGEWTTKAEEYLSRIIRHLQ